MFRVAILTAVRGYDDTKLITACWDTYKIKPVIDIRNMWRDPDATRILPGHPTVTYNYRGDVLCHDPVTGQSHTMSRADSKPGANVSKSGVLPALQACPVRVKTAAPSPRVFAFPYRPIGGFLRPLTLWDLRHKRLWSRRALTEIASTEKTLFSLILRISIR